MIKFQENFYLIIIKLKQKQNFPSSVVKVTKNVTPHELIHSLVTHLLKAVTDLRYIQTISVNSSLKTIKIYTNLTINSFNMIKITLDL